MHSSERNFARLRPDRTSIFSKQKNILMPIVYLLLTAFVRQNALSVFLRFKSITNTNLGIAILAITLTFGQQQSVHPTAAKKKTILNLRYRLHIVWTSSPGCDNVFQDSTIHGILNYYPANNHFKETNRALSTG